jgi:hypothetical protein
MRPGVSRKFAPNFPLTCDVCNRVYEILGNYSGCDAWCVCDECFNKADYAAYLEDRWPNGDDLLKLKKAERLQ